MTTWADHAVFYHLYPLGTFGAPWTNPGTAPVPRIQALPDWIEPARSMGADALLLGPIWESGTHGYDTHDYHTLDRRLGTNDDLKAALRAWKDAGFRIVFDGVFHHCGRGFAPFADLVARGQESPYADWFAGVNFRGHSPFGDPFSYSGWNGHLSLVKFNLSNQAVRDHLFAAVGRWIEDYDLDGLRLDAADVMDKEFLRALAAFCRSKKADFWLMGEVIHGNYNDWAPGASLDAVTNYELYKGLWSSLNDKNFFEVAWTLNRQFGPEGLYRGQRFVTFGDNHDVDRLASTLAEPRNLYVHALLQVASPGVPMVYYGTEAGLEGRKTPTGDEPLRPALTPSDLDRLNQQPLRDLWSRLANLRKHEPALRGTGYRQALVASQQLAFFRSPDEPGLPLLALFNSASEPTSITVEVPQETLGRPWIDLLNPNTTTTVKGHHLTATVFAHWGSFLVCR